MYYVVDKLEYSLLIHRVSYQPLRGGGRYNIILPIFNYIRNVFRMFLFYIISHYKILLLLNAIMWR